MLVLLVEGADLHLFVPHLQQRRVARLLHELLHAVLLAVARRPLPWRLNDATSTKHQAPTVVPATGKNLLAIGKWGSCWQPLAVPAQSQLHCQGLRTSKRTTGLCNSSPITDMESPRTLTGKQIHPLPAPDISKRHATPREP